MNFLKLFYYIILLNLFVFICFVYYKSIYQISLYHRQISTGCDCYKQAQLAGCKIVFQILISIIIIIYILTFL